MNAALVPRDNPIAAGDVAPDFVLRNQARAEWRLSEALKTGDVVLCFFPLAFTSTCGTEMKCVNDEIAAWQARGAAVVGISCDSTAVLKAWSEQMGLKQTLLSDMHRHVCRAYGFFLPELNVASRGTVVIARGPGGQSRVKWVQAREMGRGMNWDEVLAHLA